MNIVLINLEAQGLYRRDATEYMFPYSLVFLQNYLAKAGMESRIVDLYDDDLKDLLDICRSLKRPLVGFTSQTYNRYDTLDILHQVKAVCPSAFVVVGGKHFSYCAQDWLESVPEIDVVVRGEGEVTLHELARAVAQSTDLAGVEGISYRAADGIRHNPERRPEMDVEQFALDYNMVETDKFKRGVYLRNFQNEGIKALPLHLGRGCSQKCIFCSFGLTPYRVRKLDRVLADIVALKERFGCPYFTFVDPSFCERKAFAEAFCRRLIDERIKIKWYCEARADTPPQLLELMAATGCISLDFAVETGSPRILEVIRKRIDMQQALDFARQCRSLGVRTLVFFMISHPDETEDDAWQTFRIAERMAEHTKYVTLNVCQVLPGTQLEQVAKQRGLMAQNFRWFDGKVLNEHEDLGPKFNLLYLEHLSIDFIRRFKAEFQKLQDEQYTTSGDLWRMMKKGLRSIPRQSLATTVRDPGKFVSRVGHKLAATCRRGQR
jgi:anaerobic magnesium-protoporphyrin IX monomethyl ester cyclase